MGEAIYCSMMCSTIFLMMTEKPRSIGDQIRQIITNQKNKPTVDQIMAKMGRLLAKKQSLSLQRPVAIEPHLWLGNYLYANDRQFLLDNDIKTVISCLQLPLNHRLPQIEYLKFGLKDEKDIRFEQMIPQFINLLSQKKGNILVHCFSGRSRSVSLMLGYLIRRDRCSYDQALEKLKIVYPLASPNQYFSSTLKGLQEKLMSYSQVIQQDLLSHEPQQAEQIIEIQGQLKKTQSQSLIELDEEIKAQSPSKIQHSLIDFNEEQLVPQIEQTNEQKQQQQQPNAPMIVVDHLPLAMDPESSTEVEILPQNQQKGREPSAEPLIELSPTESNATEDLLNLNEPQSKGECSVEKKDEDTTQLERPEENIDPDVQIKTRFEHKSEANEPKEEVKIEEHTAQVMSHQQQQIKPETIHTEQKREEEQLIQHADFTQKKKRNKKKKK